MNDNKILPLKEDTKSVCLLARYLKFEMPYRIGGTIQKHRLYGQIPIKVLKSE